MVPLEPFDLGLPNIPGEYHIGLYQPIFDRILLTVRDVEQARDIALIASGRYPLFLVNLTTADNYTQSNQYTTNPEKIIDNNSCDNWTLPGEQIVPTEMSNYADFIVNATHLVPVWRHYEPDLPDEKHYLQVCWHYLKLFDSNIRGQRIKKFMSDIFDIQQNESDLIVQNLKKQIIAELYLCKDIDLVKISIENILNKAKNDLVF
jgi:hypothetical protein